MSGFVRTETCPSKAIADGRAAELRAMGYDVTVKEGVSGIAELVDVDVRTVSAMTETVYATRPAPWLVFAILRG